jgi:hypothetical protein
MGLRRLRLIGIPKGRDRYLPTLVLSYNVLHGFPGYTSSLVTFAKPLLKLLLPTMLQ